MYTGIRNAFLMCLLTGITLSTQAEIRIDLRGLDSELRDAVLANLSLARITDTDTTASARVMALYRRLPGEVRTAMHARGYYDFKSVDKLDREGDDWILSLEIDPGEPVRVTHLDFRLQGEAATDPALKASVEEFPLTPGNRFDHARYEEAKRRLLNLARERGYLDGHFTRHSVLIDGAARSANIELVYDGGRRYRFGEVSFNETVITPDRLARLLPFSEDDPYDATRLLALGRRLRDTRYFADVAVRGRPDAATDFRIPVSVELTALPKNDIRVGAGYGTDSGPRVVAAWDNRYLNRRGHRLSSELKLSPSIYLLSGAYILPGFDQVPGESRLSTALSREETDTHISNTFTLLAQRQRLRGDWNETIGLGYQYEDFEIGGEDSYSNLLIPRLGYWRGNSEDPIRPAEGYRLQAQLQGAMEGVLSDTSFVQARLSGKYIYTPWSNGRLLARAELGLTYTPRLDDLPASIRFFAGGDNSIRGFDMQSLGPTDEQGTIIGGRHLAVASLEYEHLFTESIGAAVFLDAGNAFNRFSGHIAYGSGVGLRWVTPVGLLRIDLAFGISEDPVPMRLHVLIGPDL